MNRYILFCCIFIYCALSCSSVEGKNSNDVVNVKKRLLIHSSSTDIERAEICRDIGKDYCSINSDSAVIYLYEAWGLYSINGASREAFLTELDIARLCISNEYYDKADTLLTNITEYAIKQDDSLLTAEAKYEHGKMYDKRCDWIEAAGLYNDALIYYSINNIVGKQARCHHGIANCYYNSGNYDKAESYYNTAMLCYNKYNDTINYCRAKMALAHIAVERCNYQRALKEYRECVAIQKNNPGELILVYEGMGNTYYYMRDYDSAAIYYDMSISIATDSRDTAKLAGVVVNKSNLYSVINKKQESNKYACDALELYRCLNSVNGIVQCYRLLAGNNITQKHFEVAYYYEKKASDILFDNNRKLNSKIIAANNALNRYKINLTEAEQKAIRLLKEKEYHEAMNYSITAIALTIIIGLIVALIYRNKYIGQKAETSMANKDKEALKKDLNSYIKNTTKYIDDYIQDCYEAPKNKCLNCYKKLSVLSHGLHKSRN